MSLRQVLTLCLTGFVLAAPDVRADEAILGLENAVQGESNIFKTSTLEQAGANYELRPTILFRRRGDEKVTYQLLYEPSFDAYFNQTELNGVDHFFRKLFHFR